MGWRWSAVAFRRHAKALSMSESDEGLYWILKNDGWWRNFWRLSRRVGEIQKYTSSARATKKPWNVEFQGFMHIAGYCWLRSFVPNPTRAFPSILKPTNAGKNQEPCTDMLRISVANISKIAIFMTLSTSLAIVHHNCRSLMIYIMKNNFISTR